MNELVEAAVSIVLETFGAYEVVPFGLEPADFVEFATTQFSRRSDRIELARTQSLEEIYRAVDEE